MFLTKKTIVICILSFVHIALYTTKPNLYEYYKRQIRELESLIGDKQRKLLHLRNNIKSNEKQLNIVQRELADLQVKLDQSRLFTQHLHYPKL